MRRLSVLLLFLFVTLACNKEPTDVEVEPPPPETATVIAATSNLFLPQDQPIAVGGVVTWEFHANHTITFTPKAGAPDNIPAQSSGAETRTFLTAGDYDYHCDIHATMIGTINVIVP